jgi:uncharacterized protein YjbI with pentapeptide repeats
MANKEHLSILAKGRGTWNAWRRAAMRSSTAASADLRRANLAETELSGFLFVDTDLTEACLRGGDISHAVFRGMSCCRADLRGVFALGARFGESTFHHTRREPRTLQWFSYFQGTDFGAASLVGSSFENCDLAGCDFSDTTMNLTSFRGIDLSQTRGLESVRHTGPSFIDLDTIHRSHGNIPESFLRGAGVAENFVMYLKSLGSTAFDFHSCFISFSTKDRMFADRLYADLQTKGVRCWFAPEDLRIGDEFRRRIDDSIRIHDKLLLVISKDSIQSPWVEKEVETAFERERRENRTVLFPIRLDDAVMDTNEAWAADIRRTRHIADFTRWDRHREYIKAIERLLRDLKAQPGDNVTT